MGDQPAATNGSATVHGVQVQASGWVRMTIDGYQRAVCVTAHIVNGTASQITYAPEDWSYQSPTGDVHQPTPIIYDPGTAGTLPPSLQYGQLIPGGSTTGRVCFDDPGTHGTYVASYRPEITAGGRAIWLIGE